MRTTKGFLTAGLLAAALTLVTAAFTSPPPIVTGIPAVSAGAIHSLGLRPDGTVWGWGGNLFGQIGDGTTTSRLAPVRLTSLSGVFVAISAGTGHSLALKSDGSVWAWGTNIDGQVGDGSTTSRRLPVKVALLTDVVAVSAGGAHSLALKSDGTVWAWGRNHEGQLGDGTTNRRVKPTRVTGLTATSVSAGGFHSLAVLGNGSVRAWGANTTGQLGDGTHSTRTAPRAVVSLTGVRSVSAGGSHSLALKDDGSTWSWGWNASGQLGDGTTTSRSVPVRVASLSAIASLSAGGAHSLATSDSGVIWAWGGNSTGQLGDGTTTKRTVPVTIGQPQAMAVSAGGIHSLAIDLEQSAWAWGHNFFGQIGNGGTAQVNAPIPISGPELEWGVALPVFTPAAGTYGEPVSMSIATLTPGATIHFTTDGADPTVSDRVIAPGQAVTIDVTTTVKARAFKAGMTPSAIATAEYTLAFGALAAPVASPPAGTYQAAQSVTLTADPGATIRFTLDGSDPVETSPAYADAIAISATTTLKAGAFRAGYTPSPILTAAYVIDSPPDDGIPPDPATVAPPLDPTVPTSFSDATSFLYTGPHPIQRGVEAGAIVAERVAVVRGQIRDRAGAALPGVRVTVLNQTRLGHTLSRADGMYDLAVNGGGPLVIAYALDGFLPVQRTLNMPWNDYLIAPDVRLTPLDPQVTVVQLGVGAPAQTARGTAVSDEDGPRQATLIVPEGGVVANLELPDGTVLPALGQLSIRATEYTVGPGGREAMPGNLPSASGYTYAVELSADEAIQAGATRVSFAPALAFYVENFLGFPVGGAVPSGYYDRQRGEWVASDNGRIVRVLAPDASGRAELDINGDGQADTAAALAALGITDGERQKVASLYQADQTLWRVPIPHFTPWDHNWPYALPPDARPPNVSSPRNGNDQSHKGCETGGSIIECENQTLGERLPIAGTGLSLNYRSSRQAGRTAARTATVTLTQGAVSPSLRAVEVEISVAGQRLFQSFAPTETSHSWQWNGQDVYGRKVYGSQPATIAVKHLYNAVYTEPSQFGRAFALAGGTPITADRGRNQIRIEQTFDMKVGSGLAPDSMIGGWSLNVHHQYDPKGGLVSFGDGSRRDSASAGVEVKPFARHGNSTELFAARADGSAIVSNPFSTGLGYIGRDGSEGGVRFYYTDVPAVCLGTQPYRTFVVAEGPGEEMYYAMTDARLSHTGYANTLCLGRVASDGAPVNLAVIAFPQQQYLALPRLSVDKAGVMYANAGPYLYQLAPGGSPVPIAFPGGTVISQAVTGDGSMYFATGPYVGAPGRIYRRTPAGQLVLLAGVTEGDCETPRDDGPVTPQTMICPAAITATDDGTVLFTDIVPGRFAQTSSIRRLSADGFITTILIGPGASSMKVAPNGEVYLTDGRLKRLVPALEGSLTEQPTISSDDGTEVYDFDPTGRHLRTKDASMGLTVYTFGYDAKGYLTSIADRAGMRVVIERDANGTPRAIQAPFGQRTTLAINADGYLTAVSDPAGSTTSFDYDAGGLLTQLIRPGGDRYQFEYDANGRLTVDTDPAGGVQRLDRTETTAGWSVRLRNNSGQERVYAVDNSVPERPRVTVTLADGTVSSKSQLVDGSEQVSPDGTRTRIVMAPDQRFGRQAMSPVAMTTTTPSGLRRDVTTTRTVLLANASDPLSVRRSDQTITFNGRAYQSTYDALTRTLTTTTPAGRQTTTVFDAQGRKTRLTMGTLVPTTYAYSAQGNLSAITQGSRSTTFGYDALGQVSRITDPLLRAVGFESDAVGRVTAQTRPDGASIAFGFDAKGNLTSVTPPGRAAHTFAVTAVDLMERYDPPSSGGSSGMTYGYSLAREPETVTRPDGQAVTAGYDAVGRLASLTTPGGNLAYAYAPSTGQLRTVTAPDATLNFTHDGPLPAEERWTGSVTGAVQWSFNNDFRVSSERVNGAFPVAFQYDPDGLLTGAGALTLARDAANSFITGATLGAITTTFGHDAFGSTSATETVAGGASRFAVTYMRDGSGRLEQQTQTVNGIAHTDAYVYDLAGRLSTATRNGTPWVSYTYDANGNRLTESTAAGTVSAAYDGQDRLTRYGTATYTHTAAGERLTKTDPGAGMTAYGYDVLGNLRSVALPDGTGLTYIVDGANRRIGRRLNGAVTHRWIYQGPLRPVAELDASGATVTRFVYGMGANVPDYFLRGGVTYRVVTDHLGSVRMVIDASTGAVVQQIDYDPFGRVIADTNPGFQPFGYAGGLYEPLTGLVRFGARDYDAETGRWTAKDPVLFSGGDTNLYGYVRSNPINAVDRSGLITIPLLGWVDAGEQSGQSALNYWASKIDDANAGPLEKMAGVVGGLFAALWTPCSSDATLATLSAAYTANIYVGRSFWQYYPKGDPGYQSRWLTRGPGWEPPYALGQEAVEKLALPSYNPATAVREVPSQFWQFVGGPGRVASTQPGNGGGVQYLIGGWPK